MKFKYLLTIICLFALLTLTSAYAQDSWNGGSGNWSGPGYWSLGTVPGPGDDVVIYSGGNDYVILDPGTASINSLTLGGISNGFTSELTDNGVPQTLSCTNALNVGENGQLFLYGGSSLSAGASSNNSGAVGLGNGSALHVNADLSNSGTLLSGLHGLGGNSLTITGILTNQARGGFTVDGPGDVATLGGLVNFFGSSVLVERGSTLQINGAV